MELDLSTHQRDEYRQRGPEDEESADHKDNMELRLSTQVTNSAGSSKKDVGEHYWDQGASSTSGISCPQHHHRHHHPYSPEKQNSPTFLVFCGWYCQLYRSENNIFWVIKR